MLGNAVDSRLKRREQTRQEILDAAWAQAREHGIAGISLREIAAAVGMRAPSLYTYFPSKDAIYDTMFAAGYRDLQQLARELASAPVSDPVDMLTDIAQRFISFCQDSPPRYQLMFTRVIPGWVPSAEAYAVSIASYEQMAVALAQYGISGQRSLDLWTAMVSGLAAQQMANDPDGDRWRGLSRASVEMLLDYLKQTKGHS